MAAQREFLVTAGKCRCVSSCSRVLSLKQFALLQIICESNLIFVTKYFLIGSQMISRCNSCLNPHRIKSLKFR